MLGVEIEGPLAAPPPQHAALLAIVTAQTGRDVEKGAEQDRAIIARQFDETGLHDQSAQLDQLARAFAALDLPATHVGSCLHGLKPMPRRH